MCQVIVIFKLWVRRVQNNSTIRQAAFSSENGSILALALILGSAVSVLALSLVHYSFLEVQTAEEFERAQGLYYLAESGIETGLAVLNQNPGRRDSFKISYAQVGDEDGTFEVTYLFSDSTYEADKFLPRGYGRIEDLKDNEVFIVSRGTTGEENWENYHEIWALAAKAPLFEPVLTVQEVLRLEGLSDISGEIENRAGIYGSVHLNGSLIIDSCQCAQNSFIRREKESGALPRLTFGVAEPRRSFLLWQSSFGAPALFVEKDEFTAGAIYLNHEGVDGGGAFFRRYDSEQIGRRLYPGRIDFAEVPPVRFSYEDFRRRLLANAAEKFPDRLVEISGDMVWDNDSTESYNGKIVHITGNLTVENSLNDDGEVLNPLIFEGVLIVDGRLTFLHKRRENSGSVQQFKGIFLARDLICTHDKPEVLAPGDNDSFLGIEGVVIVKKKTEIISAGSNDDMLPRDLRILRGSLIGSDVNLGGPYTVLYHGELKDLAGEYFSIVPHTGYVIRKHFKPYMD